MNIELKDLLDVAFEALVIGEDALEKHYFAILLDMVKLVGSVPGAVENIGDLKAEISALPSDPAAQQDLILYIESSFASIAPVKAQHILNASLKVVMDLITMIQDALVLKNAILS